MPRNFSSLQEDGLIVFNPISLTKAGQRRVTSPLIQGRQRGVTGGWQCELPKSEPLTITDDGGVYGGAIAELSPETQEVLKLAACIGAQFDLNTLAVVSEKSPEETVQICGNHCKKDLSYQPVKFTSFI